MKNKKQNKMHEKPEPESITPTTDGSEGALGLALTSFGIIMMMAEKIDPMVFWTFILAGIIMGGLVWHYLKIEFFAGIAVGATGWGLTILLVVSINLLI